jgi:hypothetical protein
VVQGEAFKGRQFTAEVILWAVRWYLMFRISYRDLELMLLDRGGPWITRRSSGGSKHIPSYWRSESGRI